MYIYIYIYIRRKKRRKKQKAKKVPRQIDKYQNLPEEQKQKLLEYIKKILFSA